MKLSIKPVLLGTAVAVLIYLSGVFVIFTPLPFIYVWLSVGPNEGKAQILLSFVTILFIYLVVTPLGSAAPVEGDAAALGRSALSTLIDILYFIVFVIIGRSLIGGIANKSSINRLIGTPLFLVVGFSFVILVLMKLFGVSIYSSLESYFQMVVDEIIHSNQGSSSAGQQVALLKEYRQGIVQMSLRLLPGIMVSLMIIVIALNLVVSRWVMKRPAMFKHLSQIVQWKAPAELVWVAITGIFFFLIGEYLLHGVVVKYVAINGLFVVSALYFLQGSAVAGFFLTKSRSWAIRLLIYGFMIFMLHFFVIIMTIVGFIDLWVNFRRIPSLIKK